METEFDLPCCKVCGVILEWAHCWMGCDDGWVDEYEEDPINNDLGDMRACSECHGKGGYLECPNAENHAAILAEEGQGE